MVISGIDVLNLIIEVTGVIMSIFALFILLMTPGRDKATFRYLLAGFVSLLIYNLSMLSLELMDDYQKPGWLFGMQAAGFLSFLASIFTAYLISKYLLTFLGLEER